MEFTSAEGDRLRARVQQSITTIDTRSQESVDKITEIHTLQLESLKSQHAAQILSVQTELTRTNSEYDQSKSKIEQLQTQYQSLQQHIQDQHQHQPQPPAYQAPSPSNNSELNRKNAELSSKNIELQKQVDFMNEYMIETLPRFENTRPAAIQQFNSSLVRILSSEPIFVPAQNGAQVISDYRCEEFKNLFGAAIDHYQITNFVKPKDLRSCSKKILQFINALDFGTINRNHFRATFIDFTNKSELEYLFLYEFYDNYIPKLCNFFWPSKSKAANTPNPIKSSLPSESIPDLFDALFEIYEFLQYFSYSQRSFACYPHGGDLNDWRDWAIQAIDVVKFANNCKGAPSDQTFMTRAISILKSAFPCVDELQNNPFLYIQHIKQYAISSEVGFNVIKKLHIKNCKNISRSEIQLG